MKRFKGSKLVSNSSKQQEITICFRNRNPVSLTFSIPRGKTNALLVFCCPVAPRSLFLCCVFLTNSPSSSSVLRLKRVAHERSQAEENENTGVEKQHSPQPSVLPGSVSPFVRALINCKCVCKTERAREREEGRWNDTHWVSERVWESWREGDTLYSMSCCLSAVCLLSVHSSPTEATGSAAFTVTRLSFLLRDRTSCVSSPCSLPLGWAHSVWCWFSLLKTPLLLHCTNLMFRLVSVKVVSPPFTFSTSGTHLTRLNNSFYCKQWLTSIEPRSPLKGKLLCRCCLDWDGNQLTVAKKLSANLNHFKICFDLRWRS